MVMRKAPNSSGEKTSRPFFIRIKDVPQIKERNIKINQATAGVPVGVRTGGVLVVVSMGKVA
jgi:hypothetical protein